MYAFSFVLQPYLSRSKYKLFACFYEASMVFDVDGPVEFEVSIGKDLLISLKLSCESTWPLKFWPKIKINWYITKKIWKITLRNTLLTKGFIHIWVCSVFYESSMNFFNPSPFLSCFLILFCVFILKHNKNIAKFQSYETSPPPRWWT